MDRGVNVEISPNVIISIASRSALEVKGVYSLETPANVSFWRKSQQHGVRVNIVDNNKVRLEVYVIAEEGYYLPEVGLNLQEHIKDEVEKVTGMTVDRIDIYIQGIHFSKSEETER